MKKLLSLLLVLMAAATSPVFAQHTACSRTTEREVAAPDKNPELAQIAREHNAYLADLLRLSTAQVKHLYRPTYEAMQQLRWVAEADANGAEAGEALAVSQYRKKLAKILTPNQYSTLLMLEDYQPVTSVTVILAAHH